MRLIAFAAVVAALATPGSVAAQPGAHVPNPTAVGTGGAAATADSLATDAAIKALERGGNAVDAAVAAASVLSVVEPFFCGIGGGGFMVIYNADDGSVTTIDGRETAPAAMRPDSFFEHGAPLPFAAARWSGLSAGVPGTVSMWEQALDRYGTTSLAKAVAPGIAAARDGFVVDQQFHDQVQANADFFDDIRSTKSLYLDPDGTPRDVGTVLRNPGHARAYRWIAHLGAKVFYLGPIAHAMVETVRKPPLTANANHVWRPGVMTARDVKRYTALEREPTHSVYRGLDVFGS
jgi:gamma-glutamyltranspeptidase/glutathione hydrolase